nr:50S ribosomal protein L6 [Alphaproteobacteria bacterium]
MSRIGKTPVTIPQNVEITLSAAMIVVKGKLGTRQIATNPLVDVNKTDEGIQVTPKSMAKKNRMMWGTMQRNISNAVIGVTEGFTKKLEIEGVGYRAQMKGTDVQLA